MWSYVYAGALIGAGVFFGLLALVEYLTAAQERAARKNDLHHE